MQKLVLNNDTPNPLEVFVEVAPDRYVLKPKDRMVIEAEPNAVQDHFHINVYEGGVQIYPPSGDPERVLINGQPAQSWDPTEP